jgi:hypothetical protein
MWGKIVFVVFLFILILVNLLLLPVQLDAYFFQVPVSTVELFTIILSGASLIFLGKIAKDLNWE